MTLVNFGTFTISKRKARMGRNPRTGEALKIPAARIPKFSAGKELKAAVKPAADGWTEAHGKHGGPATRPRRKAGFTARRFLDTLARLY